MRIAIFSLLWLVLAQWQLSSLIVGVVFIVVASLLSLYLAPVLPPINAHKTPSYKVLRKRCSFFIYFFSQSLRGGWDIAILALTPKLHVSPGVVQYQTALSSESQLFTFIQVLSLLPGTVSASRNGRTLSIHVLDLNSYSRSDIDDCQQKVADLVGVVNEQPLEVKKK